MPVKPIRCPNGSRRNKQTGKCTKKSKTKNRCPNGTRRNKKTRRCNKIKKTIKKTIQKTKKHKKHKKPKTLKSYSPSINKSLKKIKTEHLSEILNYDCLTKFDYNYLIYKMVFPEIMINGECVPIDKSKSQKILLQNMKYTEKHIVPKNVIAPKQLYSNCWFNSLFMTFFVSDKGRKFFKFFRKLMIVGKTTDKKLITPKKLRISFAYLNILIESALSGHSYMMHADTNIIIESIYNNIKNKDSYKWIKNKATHGNPLEYYKEIIKYLDTGGLRIKGVELNSKFKVEIINSRIKEITRSSKTELITIEVMDKQSMDFENVTEFTTNSGNKYVLDSCTLRDTKKIHFISYITLNGEEYVFDGGSTSRLIPFNWKHIVNTDKDLTNISLNLSIHENLHFNFKKGYKILYYYRI